MLYYKWYQMLYYKWYQMLYSMISNVISRDIKCYITSGIKCYIISGIKCYNTSGIKCYITSGIKCYITSGIKCYITSGVKCYIQCQWWIDAVPNTYTCTVIRIKHYDDWIGLDQNTQMDPIVLYCECVSGQHLSSQEWWWCPCAWNNLSMVYDNSYPMRISSLLLSLAGL